VALTGCARRECEAHWNSAVVEQRRGNTAKSLAEAEDAAAKARANGAGPWDWQFRLLAAELRIGKGEYAGKLAVLSEVPPPGSAYDGVRARQKYLQARLTYSQQNYPAAIQMLREAQPMASAASDTGVLLDAQLLEGVCLTRTGKHADADRVFGRALDTAERAKDRYHHSGAMLNLGFNRLRQLRFDEALPYFETVAHETGPDALTLHSVALNNEAICYSRLGEFDRAAGAQEQAIEIQEKAEARPFLQQTLAETGNNLILAGKPREGLHYLERALALAQKLNDRPQAAMWAGNLAVAYIGSGDWDKAAWFNDRAISLKQQVRGADTVYNLLNAALIAAGRRQQGRAAELFEKCLSAGKNTPAILWEANAGLGELYATAKPALASKYFESALATIERTQSDLLKPEYKISYLSRLMHFYQVYVDALCRRGEWEKALEIADSSRARVLAERSNGSAPKRLTAAAIRRVAEKSGPLLFYWLAPERSFAWVLSSKGINGVELAPAAEIEKRVTAYQSTVDDTMVDPLATSVPAAAELRDLIVKPVARWLPPNKAIVVLPDGALNNLNLETLPVYGDRPHYWVEDVLIRIAPSLSMLAAEQTAPRQRSSPSLLLIGDPVPPDRSIPRLPSAGLEVQSVAREFDDDSKSVYRGKQATPKAYLDGHPEQFSVIHFTAHAMANYESPLDSAIALSTSGLDYKLYARDILDRPIRAGLVTMSSCRGAGARSYTGEGMVGFAWAFLRAGARNVIAGLWDVNDDSTARLMTKLYAELKSRPPAEALREAKLSLIRAGAPWSRPYYWGAFQLYTATP
jgi:CHAT domain-containing protein/tetratricopeptide (TPR) repeat protein